MVPDATTLSWSHTADESRLLRALVALPMGVIAGGVLAFVAGVVGFSVFLFMSGNHALGIATLVAFVFGVARVAPHLFVRIDGEHVYLREFHGLRKWYVGAGAVVGLGVLAVGGQFGRTGLLVAVGGVLLVPLLVAAVLSSEGALDARARTLTYGNTDIDLAALDGVRRLSVGGYVGYRLAYVPGAATFSTPRHVVVPRRVDPEIRAAFDAGVAADAGERSSNRAVRIAATAMGVFFLGFAGVLLTVEPTTTHPRGQGVLWYAALVSATFGVLFVGVGVRGG